MKAKHYLLLGLLFAFLPLLAPFSHQWFFIPITRDYVVAIHPVFTPLMYLCFSISLYRLYHWCKLKREEKQRVFDYAGM